MKAEDTVMTDDECGKYVFRVGERLRDTADYPSAYNAEGFFTFSKAILNELLQSQAEISFKAGEKDMFNKLRQALRGEPVVFDYALDGVEIPWLYEHTKILFKPKEE